MPGDPVEEARTLGVDPAPARSGCSACTAPRTLVRSVTAAAIASRSWRPSVVSGTCTEMAPGDRDRDRVCLEGAPGVDDLVAGIAVGLQQVVEHRDAAGARGELAGARRRASPPGRRTGRRSPCRDSGSCCAAAAVTASSDAGQRRVRVLVGRELEGGQALTGGRRLAGHVRRDGGDRVARRGHRRSGCAHRLTLDGLWATGPTGARVSDDANPALGVGLVVLGAVCFTVNAGVSRVALRAGVDPAMLTTVRVTFTFLVLLAVAACFRRSALRPPSGPMSCSSSCTAIVGVAGLQWSYFVAIDRLPVGMALLLEYQAPVLVALWARVRPGRAGASAVVARPRPGGGGSRRGDRGVEGRPVRRARRARRADGRGVLRGATS